MFTKPEINFKKLNNEDMASVKYFLANKKKQIKLNWFNDKIILIIMDLI